jgi:CPA2 family monovalent cation:H+ antiporter-2
LRLHIVSIIRGGRRINIPDADERLFPYDKLIVAGSDENIRGLVEFLDARAQLSTDADEVQPHIVLSQYVVETNSPLLGKSMIELSIQQKSECMIISVSRGEEAYVHVSASFIFEEGDTLLLAGEQVRLDNFEQSITAH